MLQFCVDKQTYAQHSWVVLLWPIFHRTETSEDLLSSREPISHRVMHNLFTVADIMVTADGLILKTKTRENEAIREADSCSDDQEIFQLFMETQH